MLFAVVAQGSGREQHDQRPQSLAAAHDDVLGYLGDERNVAFEALADEPVHGLHVVIGERRDVVDGHGFDIYLGHLHRSVMMPESRGLGEIRVFFARR